ncbi:MAG TPA: hypothetical protein VMZ53_31780 [Kofleriaceae bacterium]|nr:hypothetical protein [Kofleriaceae bacterium]
MTSSLATSPDGQWAVAREGRELAVFANAAGAPIARLGLDSDDTDVALVGPPTSLVLVSRDERRGYVTLYQPPDFQLAARLEIESPMRLAAITGPRLALVSPDMKQLVIVRTAGKALASQKLEVTGPIEFVVGLERNQVMLGLLKKIEVWDAVSGRPLLRPQFQFPPPPRVIGTASGHMWAMREGGDEIFVYRLSDGRPFRHYAGSQIREVVSNPASPVLLLVTERGLVRLHCYAHSLQLVDGVPQPAGALALLALGEETFALGYTGGGDEPWRMSLTGTTAPATTTTEAAAAATAAANAGQPVPKSGTTPRGPGWRDALVGLADRIAQGGELDVPTIALDTELGELANRLKLTPLARRGLIILYALHLAGVRGLSIAKLAEAIGDWSEALGQGDLGALALVKTKHGNVRLRRAVTDALDGLAPRNVRLVGNGPSTAKPGAFRVGREGRADVDVEAELVRQLGRIAVVEGRLHAGLLEARLHGAAAVTTCVPDEKPLPWPRDASLVLVLYGTASSWVADVPTLPSATAS